MIPVLSLVTSVKDYLEVVHKLIEYDSINMNYTEFGTIFTYFLISVKTCVVDFFSFSWLKNIWSLPVIMPEISSAMISEISVLDGYFHNAFNFLETPVSYGQQNGLLYGLEKFTIGLLNSLFLFLPTSTAHIITLRRFVMQGLDAGYVSGLGTIAGNVLWLTSVIFGWRFFVIPWLSLDIFRYLLGFVLLIKYMWDSYNEQKTFGSAFGGLGNSSSGGLDDTSKRKIFLLNFLLALTEQTSIYPFISNLSISPETSLLESFPVDTYAQFISIHSAYLLGITLGCFSLLHFTCWFWENPAFKIYMWVISSFKVSTSFYYKALNFTFLYLTMISAISSIPYYGLDYTITNPLGYVNDDRIIQDKLVLETSFLGGKASDRNTRRNRGRHGRRERWKRRIRKYRTFDASLYDQGIYDLFTIEDLNYGFDRFWLRRKLRNHRVRFRFFPGPWMRTFKKQLAKPRLESYTGPRSEFFRILFEQVYHPSFHAYMKDSSSSTLRVNGKQSFGGALVLNTGNDFSIYSRLDSTHRSLLKSSLSSSSNSVPPSSLGKLPRPSEGGRPTTELWLAAPAAAGNSGEGNYPALNKAGSSFQSKAPSAEEGALLFPKQRKQYSITENLINENSTLRKFVRKLDTRLKTSVLGGSTGAPFLNSLTDSKEMYPKVYSKQWKHLFSKIYHDDSSNKTNNRNFNTSVNSTLPAASRAAAKVGGAGINMSSALVLKQLDVLDNQQIQTSVNLPEFNESVKKQNVRKNLSKKDFQILRYRSLLAAPNDSANSKNLSQISQKASEGGKAGTPSEEQRSSSLFLTDKGGLYKEEGGNGGKGKEAFGTTQNKNDPMFLLHPLKFYLQREAAFKRKLRYYSPSVFRKFSVENNAPYFRVMMRRYFYNYKPSLRWERTMKVASLRKARRKTTRIPRKLQLNSNYNFTKEATNKDDSLLNAENPSSLMASKRLQKPTYNYSVVSKKASRYRYQIYKDVLQHWYYSPFNRLLLKFDVDSFIRRQPNAHFLTAKEENLLHLRRFLISEHYNTLRWYTNMEHYRSMKTRLGGGSKSFASRAYNQQFSGTFKKIRHLFAITPSQGQENIVLKFDQPLYNEVPNTSKNPLLNQLVIHEELSLDFDPRTGGSSEAAKKEESADLLSQSQNIVREYLTNSRAAREQYIKNLLNENNYTKLTQFLYKGQKIRGTEPTTNQRLFNNQEKDALLTQNEKNQIDQQLKSMKLRQFMMDNNLMEDLYVTYLKKWKRKVNDQEALKNYLSQRIEKREKRKQKKEKHLLNKLKRLENWFKDSTASSEGFRGLGSKAKLNLTAKGGKEEGGNGSSAVPEPPKAASQSKALPTVTSFGLPREGSSFNQSSNSVETSLKENDVLTTGLQKAIFEGMSTSLNVDTKVKTPYEKTFWKVLLLSKIKKSTNNTLNQTERTASYKDLSLRFNDLKTTQQITLSKDIQASASQLRNLLLNIENNKNKNILFRPNKTDPDSPAFGEARGAAGKKLAEGGKTRAKKSLSIIQSKVSNLYHSFTKTIPSYLGLEKITNLLKPIKRKSLKNWRKKERASGKQKRSRKEFKMLNKKVELKDFTSNLASDRNQIEFALLNSSAAKPSQKDAPPAAAAAFGGRSRKEETIGSLDPTRKKRDMQTSSNTLSGFISSSLSEGALLKAGAAEGGEAVERGTYNKGTSSSTTQESFGFFNRKGIFFEDSSFKRKRSPQRRARVRRNRGVFKKRTLSDSLKKDIKNFYKNSESPEGAPFLTAEGKELSSSFINKMNTNLYSLTSPTSNSTVADNQSPQKAPLKQRKSKQRKQRVWKQKRSKFSQKRRKYRKRKRYSLGKIRILSKQLKRVKNKIEIQNWWWKQFVPSIQASTDALWQIEKDKLIQQKLSELSSVEILERDQMFNLNSLQIGNKDFKPLALPEAIRIKDTVIKNQTFSATNADNSVFNGTDGKKSVSPTFGTVSKAADLTNRPTQQTNESSNFDVVNKLYENLFIQPDSKGLSQSEALALPMAGTAQAARNSFATSTNNEPFKPFMVPNTMLPFYAGWDESLRKFVVTNRMLSRQDAGFEIKQLNYSTTVPSLKPLRESLDKNQSSVIEFSQAPVQGMNAATTLYWQIPFTTYDPDQFFALGMDGFSPIGWRKFLFRHSILKTWLNTIASTDSQKFESTNFSNSTFSGALDAQGSKVAGDKAQDGSFKGLQGTENTQKTLIVKSKTSLINTLKTNKNTLFFKRSEKTFDAKNTSRRLKKRYRRVKKHPRTPVWFPSGPLLNQVLPVHYIYVFYKRARLPRDRYLKRRLLNTKTINKSEGLNTLKSFGVAPASTKEEGGSTKVPPIFGAVSKAASPYFNYDFTLRKRLKPKRKYHLKRDFYSSNVVIPRRFKFISTSPAVSNRGEIDLMQSSTKTQALNIYGSPLRWRPLSSLKINKPIVELVKEQKFLRSKQRRKDASSKQQTPLLRVKQLRRRVQRQVLRSVWRYRPRAGGFVWPGDYLKLELVKAPKLQMPTEGDTQKSTAISKSTDVINTTSLRSTTSKSKRKKKRTLVEWQIQPKKYLYEKHNIKVLKKKLEKSFRSDKLRQKIKELNYKL